MQCLPSKECKSKYGPLTLDQLFVSSGPSISSPPIILLPTKNPPFSLPSKSRIKNIWLFSYYNLYFLLNVGLFNKNSKSEKFYLYTENKLTMTELVKVRDNVFILIIVFTRIRIAHKIVVTSGWAVTMIVEAKLEKIFRGRELVVFFFIIKSREK